MLKLRFFLSAVLVLLLLTYVASASSVMVKLSGPGAVNDSTIRAGEPVSFDLYFENDAQYRGFSLGFKITSSDINSVIHVPDSGNGLNKRGDIKGYNGWHDKSIWDLGGVYVVESNWDGQLPELIGFGGICVKQNYEKHDWAKNLSMDMIFNDPGTIVIDSSFFPPTGKWMYAPPNHYPTWYGPYKFNVIK